MSTSYILNMKDKHAPLQKNGLVNLKCENFLQNSSKNTESKSIFDKTDDQKDFEKNEMKTLALVSMNFVESQFEEFGLDIVDKNVCQIIADQCSYKLNEIINASIDYMNHCGRSTFTIDDFNKGLFFCGEKTYKSCENLPSPAIEKLKDSKTKTSIDCKILQKTAVLKERHCVFISEKWLNDISPLSVSVNELSDKLQNYFEVVTEILFFNNDEMYNVILNDLQMNKNIFQLVPHFINFFCENMKTYCNNVNCNFLKISLLLKLLDFLLVNPHLYFGQDSYLNILSQTLLKFLVANLPNSDQDIDCWTLKDTAASILAFILKKSKNQHLFFEVLYFIYSVLHTFEDSFNSHYGALVALNSIGMPAVLILFPSYVLRFYKHSQMSQSYHQNRCDYQMVKGQIIRAHCLLVDFYLYHEVQKPMFSSEYHFDSFFFLPDYLKNIKVFPILSHSIFPEYFGEALLPSFSFLNFVSHSIHLKKKNRNIIKKNKR